MRVALVTGGARGIGRAIARQLTNEGWFCVLADLDGDRAVETAATLGGVGMALDVRDAEAFAALVRRVEADHGPVDVLVNNAGIMPLGELTSQPVEMDHRQIDINVHGVIAGMRAVLPHMRARRRGHIVNIASVAGRIGCANGAVYSAAKHAVIGLTEAVRYEVEDEGVRLSYVCPAFVRTELIQGAPGPRWPPPVAPEDVARAVSRVLRTGQVDAYVPRIARLSVILPAILPRSIVEPVGKLFGLTRMFSAIDHGARAAYSERIEI
ncbi:MAG: SDR family NAD(P)-dependent oxidoreductase [Myxococcota bacterium]